jgi:hypothetical protein
VKVGRKAVSSGWRAQWQKSSTRAVEEVRTRSARPWGAAPEVLQQFVEVAAAGKGVDAVRVHPLLRVGGEGDGAAVLQVVEVGHGGGLALFLQDDHIVAAGTDILQQGGGGEVLAQLVAAWRVGFQREREPGGGVEEARQQLSVPSA